MKSFAIYNNKHGGIKKQNFHHKVFTACISLNLVFFCGNLFTSCDLDETPYDFYNTDIYYENTDRLNQGVLGVYEVFSELENYGQYWLVYDTDSDISHIQGAGNPGGHPARDIGHYYNIYPNNLWLQSTWSLYYTGIDRANLILEKQDQVVSDTSDFKYKNQLIAETKCLRAMCYFDLITLFGDVPLKLTYSKAQDDFQQGRVDKELIYDVIIKDLEEAYPDMPWAGESGYVSGRLSKGAALGLLSRVYLFRGGYSLRQNGTLERPDNYLDYYNKVVQYTDTIIDSQKHGLLNSYELVFRNMCNGILNPYENMYEVQFYNPTGENKHSSMIGTYNGPPIAAASPFGRANSFIKTHIFFYQTYDIPDLRKDVAVAKYQIQHPDGATVDTYSYYNDKNSYNWSPGKWRRDWQTFPIKHNNNTDCNYLLLRYADILLMRAEVENEIHGGPTQKALDCVNQIKRRAWGKPYQTADLTIDYTMASFSGKDSFFTFIKAERARELCFEGLRRFDLIRWNALKKAIDDTTAAFASYYTTYRFTAGDYFTTGKHELYPIPLNEITQTRGMITQNPKYSN